MSTTRLVDIAPRIGRAIMAQREENMRGLRRCSCGEGWRIIGYEYDYGSYYGSCFNRLGDAQAARDRLSRYALPREVLEP